MSSQKTYPAKLGKHAGRAARLASNGENEKALLAAQIAAGERQLLHPLTWHLWAASSDEVFEKALSMCSRDELDILRSAENPHYPQENIVIALSQSHSKISALSAAGININTMALRKQNADGENLAQEDFLPTAAVIAWSRPLANIEALMIAGGAPPDALPASARAMFARRSQQPKTALHVAVLHGDEEEFLLAGGGDARMAGLVRWLSDSDGISTRNHKGLDALKLSAIMGKKVFFQAILAEGGSLMNRDGSGATVKELLESIAGAASRNGDSQLLASAKAMLSMVQRKLEAVEIDCATGNPEPLPKSYLRI